MSFSEAERWLIEHDDVLGEQITLSGPVVLRPSRPYFEALVRSIISQQISVKAAAKIFERFSAASQLVPVQVLQLQDDDMRAIGLSGQKARYIRDLATHFEQDSAVFNHLDSLAEDDVIHELTKVTGIGVWTAQMFLMFTLQRPDVFAPDDRGLQLAISKLYGLTDMSTRHELDEFARRWSPFRTTASLHLWRFLDNEPTAS